MDTLPVLEMGPDCDTVNDTLALPDGATVTATYDEVPEVEAKKETPGDAVMTFKRENTRDADNCVDSVAVDVNETTGEREQITDGDWLTGLDGVGVAEPLAVNDSFIRLVAVIMFDMVTLPLN